MGTNWRDFGIGMASGIALCFVLYFGWGLIHPRHPDPVGNVVATSNTAVGMDENALIAANAERPQSNNMTPPPQLRPQPRNDMMGSPDDTILPDEVRPAPPVTRPRPRPRDEPPPEDVEPDDDGGKPDY